ncbi:MAG: YbhB/YbcL family Raf kinase inhibitor-like protein [Candidatus Krumholzibacteriia bacterium]
MARQNFRLVSSAFRHGADIPSTHTCDGSNVSPPLSWEHVAEETRSFVVVVEDLDASSEIFTHWVLFDIPADTRQLARGVAGVGVTGRNDFQTTSYRGPCPPAGDGGHRYVFRLHALDVATLELPEGSTRVEVQEALASHVLDEADLMGRYRRGRG